ncbi:MAG: hypothetical protein ACUVTP_07225 [Candidatus Fervidibacter sp.]|uniref:hypothetical protein n=1 Tax=Candidatus Fervidibacter sp. TaxID=3100871 RepID=UPI0040491426
MKRLAQWLMSVLSIPIVFASPPENGKGRTEMSEYVPFGKMERFESHFTGLQSR